MTAGRLTFQPAGDLTGDGEAMFTKDYHILPDKLLNSPSSDFQWEFDDMADQAWDRAVILADALFEKWRSWSAMDAELVALLVDQQKAPAKLDSDVPAYLAPDVAWHLGMPMPAKASGKWERGVYRLTHSNRGHQLFRNLMRLAASEGTGEEVRMTYAARVLSIDACRQIMSRLGSFSVILTETEAESHIASLNGRLGVQGQVDLAPIYAAARNIAKEN